MSLLGQVNSLLGNENLAHSTFAAILAIYRDLNNLSLVNHEAFQAAMVPGLTAQLLYVRFALFDPFSRFE